MLYKFNQLIEEVTKSQKGVNQVILKGKTACTIKYSDGFKENDKNFSANIPKLNEYFKKYLSKIKREISETNDIKVISNSPHSKISNEFEVIITFMHNSKSKEEIEKILYDIIPFTDEYYTDLEDDKDPEGNHVYVTYINRYKLESYLQNENMKNVTASFAVDNWRIINKKPANRKRRNLADIRAKNADLLPGQYIHDNTDKCRYWEGCR